MSGSSKHIRAAQYLRMSTDIQDHSIAYQRACNEAYATERGYQIVLDFVDEAVTGLKIERRDALQALVAAAVSGTADFSAILVYDVSRWGRFQNHDESAFWEFICARAGVTVEYTAEPGLNDGSLTATLVKAVKRVMAAEYSRELSMRLTAAKRHMISQGYWTSGPAPYGYVRQLVDLQGREGPALKYGDRIRLSGYHCVLRPEPTQAATVRRVFSMYRRGRTKGEIVCALNDSQTPYRPHVAWNVQHIGYMLQNEIYAGVMVHGRAARHLGSVQKRAPCEWVRIQNFAPALITPAAFAGAQRERLRRRHRMSPAELLAGLRLTLKEKGRLSAGIVSRSPHCASEATYQRVFGSLGAAYALIEYQIDPKWRLPAQRLTEANATRSRRETLSDAALLDQLRVALARHGRLTIEIITRAPELCSAYTYRKRFGGLRQAYALAGYRPSPNQRVAFETHPVIARVPDC